MSSDRPGLLRQRSSYGPPLDASQTFNDGDPKENARRNSLSMQTHLPSALVVPPMRTQGHALPTSRGTESGPFGNGASTPTCVPTNRTPRRRVSFSNPDSPTPSVLTTVPLSSHPDLLPMFQTAHGSFSMNDPHGRANQSPHSFGPYGSERSDMNSEEDEDEDGFWKGGAPRTVKGSDPGPATKGWADVALERTRAASLATRHSAALGEGSIDGLERQLHFLSKYVPKEYSQRGQDPLAKVREWVDMDTLRACWEIDKASQETEMSGRKGSNIPKATNVMHTPIRTLYWCASTLVECRGQSPLRVPVYLAYLTQEIDKSDLSTLGPDFYSIKRNRSVRATQGTFIASLDSTTHTFQQATYITHKCSGGVLLNVLNHLLVTHPAAPLDPSVFEAFINICFLSSRELESRKFATAPVRCKTGELSVQEKKRIEAAHILFRMMPTAHSESLTFLLDMLTRVSQRQKHLAPPKRPRALTLHPDEPVPDKPIQVRIADHLLPTMDSKPKPAPSTTPGELAQFLGFAICGPRLPVEYLISTGDIAPPKTKMKGREPTVTLETEEQANAVIVRRSQQILFWLLCYWEEIRKWRMDRSSDTFDTVPGVRMGSNKPVYQSVVQSMAALRISERSDTMLSKSKLMPSNNPTESPTSGWAPTQKHSFSQQKGSLQTRPPSPGASTPASASPNVVNANPDQSRSDRRASGPFDNEPFASHIVHHRVRKTPSRPQSIKQNPNVAPPPLVIAPFKGPRKLPTVQKLKSFYPSTAHELHNIHGANSDSAAGKFAAQMQELEKSGFIQKMSV